MAASPAALAVSHRHAPADGGVMGYMLATGMCWGCGTLIVFNPRTVPSVDNQPVCRACMDEFNRWRQAAGMDPVLIPLDAYDVEEAE